MSMLMNRIKVCLQTTRECSYIYIFIYIKYMYTGRGIFNAEGNVKSCMKNQ